MADIEVSSDKIVKALDKLVDKMADMTPAFKDIADYELAQTKLRFIKERDPDGNEWETPFTIRRDGGGGRDTTFNDPWEYVIASNYKAAPPGFHFFDKGRDDKILRDTGNLFNSLSRAYGPGYAIVGTNVSYADDNQFGLGNTKARPFLGLNRQSVQNVEKVIKFYLMGTVK